MYLMLKKISTFLKGRTSVKVKNRFIQNERNTFIKIFILYTNIFENNKDLYLDTNIIFRLFFNEKKNKNKKIDLIFLIN